MAHENAYAIVNNVCSEYLFTQIVPNLRFCSKQNCVEGVVWSQLYYVIIKLTHGSGCFERQIVQ